MFCRPSGIQPLGTAMQPRLLYSLLLILACTAPRSSAADVCPPGHVKAPNSFSLQEYAGDRGKCTARCNAAGYCCTKDSGGCQNIPCVRGPGERRHGGDGWGGGGGGGGRVRLPATRAPSPSLSARCSTRSANQRTLPFIPELPRPRLNSRTADLQNPPRLLKPYSSARTLLRTIIKARSSASSVHEHLLHLPPANQRTLPFIPNSPDLD